jgi:hypothetical protein
MLLYANNGAFFITLRLRKIKTNMICHFKKDKYREKQLLVPVHSYYAAFEKSFNDCPTVSSVVSRGSREEGGRGKREGGGLRKEPQKLLQPSRVQKAKNGTPGHGNLKLCIKTRLN